MMPRPASIENQSAASTKMHYRRSPLVYSFPMTRFANSAMEPFPAPTPPKLWTVIPPTLHAATPVVAVHVRRGDSCDRERDEPGPFNSMFAWDKAKGRLDRVGFRYCYTWRVYLEQLKLLQIYYENLILLQKRKRYL